MTTPEGMTPKALRDVAWALDHCARLASVLLEPIAMGYIQAGAVSGVGDTVEIQVRGKAVAAEIVSRPFYKRI